MHNLENHKDTDFADLLEIIAQSPEFTDVTSAPLVKEYYKTNIEENPKYLFLTFDEQFKIYAKLKETYTQTMKKIDELRHPEMKSSTPDTLSSS